MSTSAIGSSILSVFNKGTFDVNTLATALATSDIAARKAGYEAQQTKYANKQAGMDLLQQAFRGLQIGLADLGSAATFTKVSANSSDASAISATINGKPSTATYNVVVNQLAQAQSVASGAYASQTSPVGEGTFSITVGGVSKDITIGANNNSLSSLRDSINSAGLPVNASIVNDGSGYRLLMSSQQTGVANGITVNVTDADGNNTDTNGLSRLASANLTTTVAAQDANLSINGLNLNSSTNVVDGAIEGLTLNLNKAETGVAKTITIGANTADLKDKVQSMVEDYNAMVGIMANLGSYSKDDQDPTKGALAGDSALRSARSQLREMLNFRSDTGGIQSLADAGVVSNRDGTIKFDESRFNAALAADPTSVSKMFAAVATASDPQVSFIGATDKTVVGKYSLDVVQAAREATYLGATAAGLATDPMVIDASNNSFSLTLNGTASSTLTLAQGSFSRTEVAGMLQAAINNDSAIKAKGYAVNVTFDSDNNRFQMSTRDYGSAMSINFNSVGSSMATTLGLDIGSGAVGSSAGADVLGSLKDASGRNFVFAGVGQNVKIQSLLPGSPLGLEFSVAGSAIGDRGTLDFNRGYASQLNLKINSFLDSKEGLLGSSLTSITQNQTKVADQLKKLDERYQLLVERYSRQFTAANEAMSRMNSLSASLASTFNTNKEDN
jgi:flagellar hook-associated protein 2